MERRPLTSSTVINSLSCFENSRSALSRAHARCTTSLSIERSSLRCNPESLTAEPASTVETSVGSRAYYGLAVTKHSRTAITGGNGFVGRHVAARLGPEASVVISRRTGVDTSDVDALARAFEGCEVVAHCAGINREIGDQTYQRVHIEGTANVIEAAKRAGVRKVIILSFLRARPDCGSPYHESKWAAEDLIRGSGLDYTILKAGTIYGRGDYLIDHLSHTVQTLPLFATVGFHEKPIRRRRPSLSLTLPRQAPSSGSPAGVEPNWERCYMLAPVIISGSRRRG